MDRKKNQGGIWLLNDAGRLRLDDLENGLYLYQNPELFCFGMDAVLLAAFEEARPGERVMDLCTGNGIVPHLMAARAMALRSGEGRPGENGRAALAGQKRPADQKLPSFSGLELLPESVELARASVARNGLEGLISIDQGDVREAAARYAAASFSMVTCNPPYVKAGSGLRAGSYEKELARSEIELTFADVAGAAAHLLAHGGRFVLVHRPNRLPEILRELQKAKLEPKRLCLVYPREGAQANLFLLTARKNGRPELAVEPPLFVYNTDGTYTDEILRIYGKTREA